MRITPTKLVTTFFGLIVLILLWNIIDRGDIEERVTVCQHSETFVKQLHDLTDR